MQRPRSAQFRTVCTAAQFSIERTLAPWQTGAVPDPRLVPQRDAMAFAPIARRIKRSFGEEVSTAGAVQGNLAVVLGKA